MWYVATVVVVSILGAAAYGAMRSDYVRDQMRVLINSAHRTVRRTPRRTLAGPRPARGAVRWPKNTPSHSSLRPPGTVSEPALEPLPPIP